MPPQSLMPRGFIAHVRKTQGKNLVEECMIFSKILKITILKPVKAVPEFTHLRQRKNKTQSCDIQSHMSNPGKPGDPISWHLRLSLDTVFSLRFFLPTASQQGTWIGNSRTVRYRLQLLCLPKISSSFPLEKAFFTSFFKREFCPGR